MKRILAVVASAALISAGCFKSSSTVTTPTNSSSTLGGTWVTVTHVPGSFGAQTCTNFTWSVTSFTGSTGSGTFGATCFGNMQITGSASGTINGSNIAWTANATATVAGQPACAISLSGTATLQTDRITIPWSGTACGTMVGGTETVKR